MQLLFDRSFEYGEWDGLGLIPKQTRLGTCADTYKFRIWDGMPSGFTVKTMSFKYINEGEHVYFVHSYCAVHCEESIAATVSTAAYYCGCRNGNVFGCQFHPESSIIGLKYYRHLPRYNISGGFMYDFVSRN